MRGYQNVDFVDIELSVAMTESLDEVFASHLDKGPNQEDLTFAYWRASRGLHRYTAVIHEAALPGDGDRILQGNVAFTSRYFERVLDQVSAGSGIALLHSHLGPGWQDMSEDDEVAERDRLAGPAAARTGLPILGLTRGTDGAWSARLWLREMKHKYVRRWASTVRVVGHRLRVTHHPDLSPVPLERPSQQATISVWGEDAQSDLVRIHAGVIGLGSVGSIVAEGLARIGLQRITYLDHDVIEERNLDRTLGATDDDANNSTPKVEVARRIAQVSHTSSTFTPNAVPKSLLTPEGLGAALDCDVLVSCVDRPWPRSVMNTIAKAHLIPMVDGGILARVNPAGHPLHVDWRIHTVGPGRRCLYCLGAVMRSDVALDMTGQLDDPDYIRGLSAADRDRYARRNVFPFSLSVASHQLLQLIGLVTGMPRIGGVGPQHYSAYPGMMTVDQTSDCDSDCEVDQLTASAVDLISTIDIRGLVQLPINPVTCATCGAIRPTELATGAPRTPCPKCGAMAINIHVRLQETLTATDTITATLRPSDQSQGWLRRWNDIEQGLVEILAPRTAPLSADSIHAAVHELQSFYVRAYHLKDALRVEAASVGLTGQQVEAAIDREPWLALLADLANLDKHGKLTKPPRSGQAPVITSVEGTSTDPRGWRLRMVVDHGGRQLDGIVVGKDVVDAWRRTLQAWGLI